MRSRYLTPALTYDRSAIMRAAWVRAHARVVSCRKLPRPFYRITTARAEFAECLSLTWGEAKAERELAVWAAARDAAPVRTLSEIEAAQLAVTIAEHSDSFTAAGNAAVRAAHAQLAALQSAA